MGDELYPECRAQQLFDEFVSSLTCRAALWSFSQLCEHLQLDRTAAERPLYQLIKHRLNYWKANALWAKLDRRAAQEEYQRARVCSNTTVCSFLHTCNFIHVCPLITIFSLSDWSVCDHRGGAMRSKDSGGVELHGSSSGAAGEERLLLQEQRPPPVALHHPRPARARREKVLRKVLRWLHRPHQ